MTRSRAGLRDGRARAIVTGVAAMALGMVAVSIAAVEFYVSADVMGLSTADDRIVLFGMTTGTGAYVLGYATAGAILVAIGAWTIHRARRGE